MPFSNDSDEDCHEEEIASLGSSVYARRRPTASKRERIKQKLANLPTLQRLLMEKNLTDYSSEELDLAKQLVLDLIKRNPTNEQEWQQCMKSQRKEFKSVHKKSFLLAGYRLLLKEQKIDERHFFLESQLVSKAPRSQSGVLVVTVFTSPYPDGQRFSCKWNCYYCPNEPGQPRSYLLNEPGVRRANMLNFDPVKQFQDRVKSLQEIGHPADKVELLVLGGTWESYPESYQERFIRDLFFAANTFFDPPEQRRLPFDLFNEQLLNETTACKIIGMTLETRPDTINNEMLVKLRKYGCTRVQLGVQHTNDSVLLAVNRDQTRDDVVRAIKLLKDACFKVDIHLMPDLPGSTTELDKRMFDDVLFSPELQADQWKIYPCQTTPFTVIHRWYEEGKYKPFTFEQVMDVILYVKRKVHPWIRLNRVIRDIPVDYVLAGCETPNLRQFLGQKLAAEGHFCSCIRCREVKGDKNAQQKLKTAELVERRYDASGGKEVFISFETPDLMTIFGFLRLRFVGKQNGGGTAPTATVASRNNNINNGAASRASSLPSDNCIDVEDMVVEPRRQVKSVKNNSDKNRYQKQQVIQHSPPQKIYNNHNDSYINGNDGDHVDNDEDLISTPFPELLGCALIRELHVYGNLVTTYDENASSANGSDQRQKVQHVGIGSKLLERAEELAIKEGYSKIAVISGLGVRRYYQKKGYNIFEAHRGGYLIKNLVKKEDKKRSGELVACDTIDNTNSKCGCVMVMIGRRFWWFAIITAFVAMMVALVIGFKMLRCGK